MGEPGAALHPPRYGGGGGEKGGSTFFYGGGRYGRLLSLLRGKGKESGGKQLDLPVKRGGLCSQSRGGKKEDFLGEDT